MSPDEMRCRTSKVLNKRKERKRLRTNQGQRSIATISAADLTNRCLQFLPGCCSADLASLSSEYSGLFSRLQQRKQANAEEILHGRWRMLGHSFDLTGAVHWHDDPRTNYRWESKFYADLPLYNLAGETDVKYPWELSRHQFLCELSSNYVLNGCEDSANRVRELLLDWIDANPLYVGVNWTSSLEVAMRSISWIWAIAGLASWEAWQDDDFAKIQASLWDHGQYLKDNFSHYSSPYNHLIGEATGLLCVAALFPDNPTSEKWRNSARKVLLDSGPVQFYQDHFCVEQAVGYHYYTLGFLMTAWLAAKSTGQSLDELTPIIHSGFKTGAAFRRPDGTWPPIGDLDSARALPVHPENYWHFDSLQNLAAVLLDDPSLKIGDVPGEELFWLAGTDGVSKWHQMETDTPLPSKHLLADAGYAIGAEDQDWLLFDAGSIAHGLFPDATPSTAHGHADTLQLLYHCNGQSVLEDCGMPFYGGDPDWVTYFRSPAAHNTVQIEDANFVKRAGRLAWSHEVQRPALDARFEDSAWLCHGKIQWSGVSHERHVCCLPGQGLWIADMIEVDRPRSATWFWQLPNDQVKASGTTSAIWGSMSLTSTTSLEAEQWKLAPAINGQPEGWRCLGYGEKVPGTRLAITYRLNQKILVLTSVGTKIRPRLGVQIGEDRLNESMMSSDSTAISFANCRWLIPAESGVTG